MRLTPFQHSIEYLNIGMVSSRGPGCHPERSEGSLRPTSQTLRGVYPERSEWAQGDRPSLHMSNGKNRPLHQGRYHSIVTSKGLYPLSARSQNLRSWELHVSVLLVG